jgi:anti-anti-sigma factor
VELVLTGELDAAVVGHLRRTVESELAERGARRLIIDLAQLDFIDAAGIAGLTDGSRLARRRGKHFGIRSPQPAVRRAFDLTGVLPELQLL